MTTDTAEKPAQDLPEGVGRKEIRRVTSRYQAVNRQRLQRIRDSLTHEQQRLLHLLPLLLHINHAGLPGFSGPEVPAGVADYSPDRDALLYARGYSSTLKMPRRAPQRMPLLGLYLIGSSGTLGQDRHSDFDFWVCHHPELSDAQCAGLRRKLDKLEDYATALGLHMHFFLMHADGFRQREHTRLSNESSGDTQHHLLLEEFYRSGLLLAGLPPLWWVIPPDQAHNYDAYRDHLVAHRFVDPNAWLDFGGLEGIDAQEFFSAAHWQLYKGIDLPYKALLKLMLFAAYACEYPNIQWLSLDIKALMHSDQEVDADAVDAYLLLLLRVEKHLAENGDTERLALARRAFYFKAGARLTRQNNPSDWRIRQLRQLVDSWGWDRGELLNLDSHHQWKLERVREERNLLVAELSASYRLLTAFARQHVKAQHLNNSDLATLGRKLYSALERRPGKIDYVNPGISGDLSEDTIWLKHTEGLWQLHLYAPEEQQKPAKSTQGLLELLAWMRLNGILRRHTRVDLTEARVLQKGELERQFKLLERLLPETYPHELPLSNFTRSPQGRLSVAFVHLVPSGLQRHYGDPLRRITFIEHLQGNSWEELQVVQFQEENPILDLLCSHLNLFRKNPAQALLHIDCPALGVAVKDRIAQLAEDLCAHFSAHPENGRYILEIDSLYYGIEERRQQFNHYPIGDQRDLLEFLAQNNERFTKTHLSEYSLNDSPLPFVLGLNRPHSVQVCLRRQREGISLFVLDQFGALHQQWYPQAEEKHLLLQLARFFATLETWHQVLPQAQAGEPAVQFLRIQGNDNNWQTQTLEAPALSLQGTELVLATGRHGPWQDGFSLLSGTREFNSAELGQDLYRQVVEYVLSLRQNANPYPLYLTGITVADDGSGTQFSLVELLGFKRLVEKRLADAMP